MIAIASSKTARRRPSASLSPLTIGQRGPRSRDERAPTSSSHRRHVKLDPDTHDMRPPPTARPPKRDAVHVGKSPVPLIALVKSP